jgi:hypothetical protein
MTFQNKENLKNLITDAENRFDQKYMTPKQFWSGYQQLTDGPHIEEVDDESDDDDFGDNKRGIVSTTVGSDNFHAEGDAINEDSYVDSNNLPNDRFSQNSPYYSNFTPITDPLLSKPQFRAPKTVPAIRPTVYDDDSIQSNDSLDQMARLGFDTDDDSIDIGKSIFEPDKQEPEPIKQPDVSVGDADDESIEEVPIKPHASENVVENIEEDEAVKLLMKQRSKIGHSSGANLTFMYDQLKGLTNNKNYEKEWKKATHNKKKTIVSKLFREFDQKQKK